MEYSIRCRDMVFFFSHQLIFKRKRVHVIRNDLGTRLGPAGQICGG